MLFHLLQFIRSLLKNPTVVITALFTAFIACAYAFGIYLFSTMIPDMRGDLGYTAQTVGLISALTQAGLMAGGLIVGHVWQRIGALRTILITQFIVAFCLILTTFVTNAAQLTLICMVLGACASFIWIPMTPYVQTHIPLKRHGIALGMMGGGTSWGVFLNGLFIPPVIENSTWRMVWLTAGSAALVLCIIGYLALKAIPPLSATEDQETKHPVKTIDVLKDLSAVFIILITMINGLAFLPFETYLTSLFRDQHGWTLAGATGLWSGIGIGGMMGGIGFGVLTDRIGPKRAMIIANAFMAFAAIAAWLSASAYIVYPAVFVFGIGYNGVFGVLAAYVARIMEPAAAGLLISLSFIALGLGSLTGNFTGGLLTGMPGGYNILYGLVAAFATANVLLTFALRREPQ